MSALRLARNPDGTRHVLVQEPASTRETGVGFAPSWYADVLEAAASDVARLIREAVWVADYGLGRDGCPFCSGVEGHDEDCVGLLFGATGEDPAK